MLMDAYPVARMSEAISGIVPSPAYRCAHAGYARIYVFDPGGAKARQSKNS
jgi:hypothetical protein